MSRSNAQRVADFHPYDCACATCEPYHDEHVTPATLVDTIAMFAITGMGVGLVACWILDRVIGGPGISVMWGA